MINPGKNDHNLRLLLLLLLLMLKVRLLKNEYHAIQKMFGRLKFQAPRVQYRFESFGFWLMAKRIQ